MSYFTSSVASRLSSPASDQPKLLRVFKTIGYVFSTKAKASPEPQPSADSEKIQGINESFCFTPLWCRLGDCLSIISEIEHIATVLLPLVEALMVVCKYGFRLYISRVKVESHLPGLSHGHPLHHGKRWSISLWAPQTRIARSSMSWSGTIHRW